MKIFKITAFIGFMILFGTAGAIDGGTMEMSDIVKNLILGMSVFGLSVMLMNKKPERKTRRCAEIIPIEELRQKTSA